jgi:peptidoglycan/xylan/chitin deacetylase (PgdA/CDA1 family)
VRHLTFTFHGVGEPPRPLDPGEEAVWLSQPRFEAALDALADGVAVRLTFDDGNRSDLEIALPALLERGLHATFFVVTERLDNKDFVDFAGVEELARAGMTLGTHGRRHIDWRTIRSKQLRDDVAASRRTLAQIAGRPVDIASCPFGSFDRRVLGVLRGESLNHVFTSDTGRSAPAAWLQRRTTVSSSMTVTDLQELSRRPQPVATSALLTAKQLAKRLR